ncbi:MAG: helix-turn-helix transcriptional regulator, partial [Tissierellales bacterium]|nr:helix-turn-helix transcriptional regulator [Tissierellales bacterium]
MSLGENIKKYRKAKKISREELGKKIGLSQYSVKKYE